MGLSLGVLKVLKAIPVLLHRRFFNCLVDVFDILVDLCDLQVSLHVHVLPINFDLFEILQDLTVLLLGKANEVLGLLLSLHFQFVEAVPLVNHPFDVADAEYVPVVCLLRQRDSLHRDLWV